MTPTQARRLGQLAGAGLLLGLLWVVGMVMLAGVALGAGALAGLFVRAFHWGVGS